jgi:hypothetical protein
MPGFKILTGSLCSLLAIVLLFTPTACRKQVSEQGATSMGETTSSQKDSTEPAPEETGSGEGDESEGYWTPERMRDAKPIEMPTPDTPPVEEEEPESDSPAEGESGVSGPDPE